VVLPLADAWLRGRRATGFGQLAQAHATVAAAAIAGSGPSTVVQNAPAATGDATITTGAEAPASSDLRPLAAGELDDVRRKLRGEEPEPAAAELDDDGTPGHEALDDDVVNPELGAFLAAGDVDHVDGDPEMPVLGDDELDDDADGPLDPADAPDPEEA
jgi:hypothetical protein